jgi:hypothetical protein
MRIYRVIIKLAGGRRVKRLGIFVDGFEAVVQTLADYPAAGVDALA